MTQPSFAFVTRDTFLENVATLFKKNPNVWIDGLDIARVGGVYAYRTRISDCRTQLGMTIENRVRRLPGKSTRVSEYRYQP